MALPVAVQLYSVRDEMQQDFLGTLKAIKNMGYQGVEFAGLFDFTPQQVRDMVQAVGLVPISAHVPLADLLADPDGVVGAYQTIGCEYIAVPYVTPERRPGAEGFAQTIADIKMLGEVCQKHGLVLLYHNHDFEFVQVDGEYGLDVLYNSVPAQLLQTEIDTCWVKVAGVDPSEYIRKYTGRAPVVHLKDFYMQGDKKPDKLYELIGIETDGKQESAEVFGFRPVGHGLQDMPAILAASEAAGANWVVVEQDRPAPGETPMDSIQKSRTYLTSVNW